MTQLREGSAEEAGFRPDRIELIRQRAQSWVDAGRTPSLVVLAARRGVIALHEAFGQLSPEGDGNDLEVDAVFPVMSVSKPVTATAAMLLVEDGLLSLNRPLRDYLPELSGEGTDGILVQHLMTHTAGYREADLFEYVATHPMTDLPERDPSQHEWVHRWLNERYAAPLSFSPGTENSYGIHCIMLLGEVVRRVSGQATDAFMRERIFQPLGMTDSSFVADSHITDRIVRRGPDLPFGTDAFLLNIDESFDVPSAAAGMLSTARDLAVFAQTFLNGGSYAGTRLLSEVSVAEMTRNQIPGIGCEGWAGRQVREASWGLGWMIQDQERWPIWSGSMQPLGTVYHQGIGACMLWFDPASEVIGVCLSVAAEFDPMTFRHSWDVDLFQNMVSTALE
jgi:CubicO group peptidase (beta-lactamase class C family)